jgi:glycosyltransferase involved in cell wall biosynthesis
MSSALNVLYLTMNPNRQSTTVPTEGWFRFLPERGLRPVLVSRELGAFHAWSTARGVPAYQDPLPFPAKGNPVPFLRSMWKLRRIVLKHRIDLIHCNEQEIYPVGQYLARLCRVPVVVSVHFTMDRAFCEYSFAGPKAPDRMLFVSRRSLEACADALQGLVATDRWRVLHNGLDLERYQPDAELGRGFRTAHGIDLAAVVVGAACAFRPRKQLEHLFEAASRLEHLEFVVLLAGFPVPGDEAYAEALLQSARAKLGDRLRFVGALEDMRGFSNALDLFVNTSREESFGIGVLEAMACGCPVVGYDSKAVDEVVLPDGGEIVPQDDIGALTAAMARWIAAPVQLTSRRQSARRQAERFDLRALSSQLWDEYGSVAHVEHA